MAEQELVIEEAQERMQFRWPYYLRRWPWSQTF